jgi:hypothetical protein
VQRWRRFSAEVLFPNPDTVSQAIEALTAANLEFEYLPDHIDDCGPTVFGTVTGTTDNELNEDQVYIWLMEIIGDLFRGDVVEWASTLSAPQPRCRPLENHWHRLGSLTQVHPRRARRRR